MNLALWIAAALLAVAFLATGLLKITRSKEKLAAAGLGWTEDFSPAAIKAIGVAEVLGAITTHARRKETQLAALNVVLLALALFVAWGRFGPYAF